MRIFKLKIYVVKAVWASYHTASLLLDVGLMCDVFERVLWAANSGLLNGIPFFKGLIPFGVFLEGNCLLQMRNINRTRGCFGGSMDG